MKVLLLTGLGALFFTYYWADNFDPASLQGARVLLTGASAGVGEELAYHYARLGSHLVLTAHTEALLQKVVGNCRKLGAPKVFYIAADMASREVSERVVQFALDKLGGLDYLVLNHLGAAPAGTRALSAQGTSWLMQVLCPSYPQVPLLRLLGFTPFRLWRLTSASTPALSSQHPPSPHSSRFPTPGPAPPVSRLHPLCLGSAPGLELQLLHPRLCSSPPACPSLTRPAPRFIGSAPCPYLLGLGSLLRHSQSPPPGELPELCATDFIGAAQSDGQQGLPGGGVLTARPRAHVLLQPLFSGQVCTGQFLRLPAAGAGHAGCERGHHHVRPGHPGSRLSCRGSQGCHKGQVGPGTQGSPSCDSRQCHAHLLRLLPVALPRALPASGLAASPKSLVHPPGAQCHCHCCCLS